MVHCYLGAVNPSSRSKPHAISKRIDKDKYDTHIVRNPVDIAGVNLWQSAVDLRMDSVSLLQSNSGRVSYQHSKSHDRGTSRERYPPTNSVNNQHIHQSTPNLHGALNTACKQ